MRLINFGVGEMSDRLTILAMKILAGAEKGQDVRHFETERQALLSKIAARTLNGSWFSHLLELGAVNAAIWKATDDLRDLDGSRGYANDSEAASLAFKMQRLNDQRSHLIEEINKLAGDHTGKEKI